VPVQISLVRPFGAGSTPGVDHHLGAQIRPIGALFRPASVTTPDRPGSQIKGQHYIAIAVLGGLVSQHVPRQKRDDQDWMNVSRSLLIVSACVVGIPCGKPAYVFSVPFCTSSTARGPEVA
jgi:hypothetical protein